MHSIKLSLGTSTIVRTLLKKAQTLSLSSLFLIPLQEIPKVRMICVRYLVVKCWPTQSRNTASSLAQCVGEMAACLMAALRSALSWTVRDRRFDMLQNLDCGILTGLSGALDKSGMGDLVGTQHTADGNDGTCPEILGSYRSLPPKHTETIQALSTRATADSNAYSSCESDTTIHLSRSW